MTKKIINTKDLAELPRKYAVAKILERRDKVAKQAKSDMIASLGAWQSTAPIKTGRMRGTMLIRSNKSTAMMYPKDGYMKVINSVNKRGKHQGFLDRYRKTHGKSFLQKF